MTIALYIAVHVGGARDDDGGGVACAVEDVGLDDESGATAFAGLLVVGLGFEVNFPNLRTFDGRFNFGQGHLPGCHPCSGSRPSAVPLAAGTGRPCGL